MINGQSAAKHLTFDEIFKNDESSTTIPRKGSTVYKYILEKPDIKFYKLNQKYKELKNLSCIYGILNINTYKIYVGSTNNLYNRILKHTRLLRTNKHHSTSLQNSYNIHTVDSYYVIVLKEILFFNKNETTLRIEYSTEEELYMILFNSVNNGYNNTYNTYRNLTSEKQIESNKLKQSKKVICLNLEGEYVSTFNSITEAAKSVKDQSTNISACCKGKLRYVKNFIWVYEDQYDSSKSYILKNKKQDVRSTESRKKTSYIIKNSKKYIIFNNTTEIIVECLTDVLRYFNYSVSGSNYKKIKHHINNKTPYKTFYIKLYEDIV